MKTKYICKCGRVVKKSTTADNTGNRDTAGCEGCPYLLPWGSFAYKPGDGYVMDVKGKECRMSHSIDYASTYYGSADDKCTLRIVSLDLDFLEEMQAWINEHAEGQLSGGFSRDTIRGTDYSQAGRYCWSIYCSQNKKGMAAKAALIQHFFDSGHRRLDMTPEEEKAHILAAIEAGKAAYQRKEDEMQTDDHGIMTDAGELLPNGTECRRHAVSRARTEMGKVQAIHVCDDQPEGVKIWLNACEPAEYWVLSKAGEIEGEHIESCPYCAALLKIGCGDVLLMPINREPKSNKPPEPSGANNTTTCSCAGCKREDCICAGEHDAAGRADCTGEQNCAQSGCTYAAKHRANPTYSAAATAAAEQTADGPELLGSADMMEATAAASSGPEEPAAGTAEAADLPEVCRGCRCATCGNEDCPTPCHQKSDEVEECEQLGPMGDDCEDYQPKEDAECLKTPAPNGDAAVNTAANAAQQPQQGETPITPTNANSSSAPACPADAGAATQSLSAAAPASLAAEDAPAFDYTGLDAQTVADLHLAEREIRNGRKMAEMGLQRMADGVAIAHDALCGSCDKLSQLKHGNRGENTFGAWCESLGLHRKAAYRLLQVFRLFDDSTPREQKALRELTNSVLYEASRPSAEPEAVEALKRQQVKTLKEFRALEAQIKAEREAREQAEQQLADAQREHQAERESTSALLRDEQQRRQQAEQGRIAAEKETAAAQQRAAKAEAQGKKDAALVEKLQDIVLQRDNEVAEQKERADAAEIRAQQAENRPVEVAVQAPDPAEVQRLASEKAAEMTAMLKAQLHTLQAQLDDAESRADAAANNAYMSAAEFAAQAAAMIDGIRASFWAMAKELPDADFNQALEPLDTAVSRIYNREWEDGWNDSWENNEEDNEQ